MADRDPGPFTADPAAYTTDIAAWTKAQAALLRERRFEALDLDNIIEEIESLGSEIGHSIESYMVVAIEHLLKLMVSADTRPRQVWRRSVAHSRGGIARRLRKSPSLRRELPEMFADAWPDGRDLAVAGLREAEEHLVPQLPPFDVAQVLDPEYWPGINPDAPQRTARSRRRSRR